MQSRASDAGTAACASLLAMILTAAFTGLRMGELLALRWRHVDFANRILHVQRNYVEGEEDSPKSHRRRSVPLSDQAVVALAQPPGGLRASGRSRVRQHSRRPRGRRRDP
jgi:integrase